VRFRPTEDVYDYANYDGFFFTEAGGGSGSNRPTTWELA
jgi:hypothetical protein